MNSTNLLDSEGRGLATVQQTQQYLGAQIISGYICVYFRRPITESGVGLILKLILFWAVSSSARAFQHHIKATAVGHNPHQTLLGFETNVHNQIQN